MSATERTVSGVHMVDCAHTGSIHVTVAELDEALAKFPDETPVALVPGGSGLWPLRAHPERTNDGSPVLTGERRGHGLHVGALRVVLGKFSPHSWVFVRDPENGGLRLLRGDLSRIKHGPVMLRCV